MKVTNWGNNPIVDANFFEPRDYNSAKDFVQTQDGMIPRGMGRSYGDSALSSNILSSLKLNKFISFNKATGALTCESGVTFDDILKTFVPKGWFLPVTPGTKFITVGGAIGSDIHGKNHHNEGTFSNHLIAFDLLLASGEIIHCSRGENEEIFWATCGGMGLTGFILKATFLLKPIQTAFIRQKAIKTRNLDELMEKTEANANHTYTVSWLDCLASGNSFGRGIVLCGEHATKEELNEKQLRNPYLTHCDPKLVIPFNFPSFTLNNFTVKAFNMLYYNKTLKKVTEDIIHYDPYFYPLDMVHQWNRIYGKQGIAQYQFVVPYKVSKEVIKEVLIKTQKSGLASFLSVLKLFGKQRENYIRFPKEGYTLTLDFPISEKSIKLMNEIDEIVLRNDGRLYLTKDGRMPKESFYKGYPEADKFKKLINEINPGNKFRSLQSQRIELTKK